MMNKVKVKICGLKRVCDVMLCHELGVDMAGFVTEYPLPVPWNLTAEEAKKLLGVVQAPMKSCIVTGGTCVRILDLVENLRPDFVQLHYNETLSDAEYIAETLQPLHIGVIKTLPFSPDERLAQFGTEDIGKCTELLNSTEIYAILADARNPSNAAGKGTPVDVELYRQIKQYAKKPVILAGGITAENLARILSLAQPDIIDVMTGVESSHGVKDREMLAYIMKQY